MPLTPGAGRSSSRHRSLTAGILSVLLFLTPLAGSAAPSASQPTGPIGSWHVVFDDEFNTGSLDLTKWQPNWNGDNVSSITPPVNGNERACYDPQQVIERNGELDLVATAGSCTAANGMTYPYHSGLIESNGKFNFTYGVFEARIWTPAGRGMWPAFWSDGQIWPNDGEIDTLEAYGTDNSQFHYYYPGGGPGGSANVPGATAGWHTYTTDWEPGIITWYYDGRKVWQLTNANLAAGQTISSSPQYLILNLGLNSAQSMSPAALRVDYVRVWQHQKGSPPPRSLTSAKPLFPPR
jgi:beta-glucanase (GH16 family)